MNQAKENQPEKPHRWATALAFQNAQRLRQEMTGAEVLLWEALRAKRLHGFKFRRQHPIGRFIADFYCDTARLIVELDGGVHSTAEQQERDACREEILTTLQGVQILRFTNEEAQNNLPAVLEAILHSLLEATGNGTADTSSKPSISGT